MLLMALDPFIGRPAMFCCIFLPIIETDSLTSLPDSAMGDESIGDRADLLAIYDRLAT